MNILITGAGLIGSNAARHAVDAGHKVVLFDLVAQSRLHPESRRQGQSRCGRRRHARFAGAA